MHSSASGMRVGEQPGVGDRRHRVALAVHHERRRPDAPRAARSCRGRRTPTSAPTRPGASRDGGRSGAAAPAPARAARAGTRRRRPTRPATSARPSRQPPAAAPPSAPSSLSVGRAARGPPGVVPPSTSPRTRSGKRIASSWAIIPPIESPHTCALSTPIAPQQAGRVGRQLGHRGGLQRRARAPGAAVVVGDAVEAAAVELEHGLEHRRADREPRDQQQRLAAPAALVVERDAVDPHARHALLLDVASGRLAERPVALAAELLAGLVLLARALAQPRRPVVPPRARRLVGALQPRLGLLGQLVVDPEARLLVARRVDQRGDVPARGEHEARGRSRAGSPSGRRSATA